MARKKAEIQLQIEIETQEEWEEMLAKEGLTVVDVYQEWCGHCKPMTSIFRRVKNELGDDLLRFVMAKSDSVDALEKYRGKCKPCFLFFAGGVLVSVIRGAMAPQIIKTITEQLAQEHRVLDGAAERKEIRDEMVGEVGGGQKFDDEEDEEGDDESVAETKDETAVKSSESLHVKKEQKKGVTVAILKPSVVEAGKVEEIIQKMEEHGIEILEAVDKQMTEEEAREFYAHKKDEPFFEDLIKHMTSGPCKVLVLSKGETGDMIIEEWRELLGPPSVEEAKEKAPESLRAQYGVENYVNAVHGSDSESSAMQELAFFFPDYVRPKIHKAAKPKIQRTLALIRPDAMAKKKKVPTATLR